MGHSLQKRIDPSIGNNGHGVEECIPQEDIPLRNGSTQIIGPVQVAAQHGMAQTERRGGEDIEGAWIDVGIIPGVRGKFDTKGRQPFFKQDRLQGPTNKLPGVLKDLFIGPIWMVPFDEFGLRIVLPNKQGVQRSQKNILIHADIPSDK